MKKLLSILLILAMLFIFTACDTEEPPLPPEPTPEPFAYVPEDITNAELLALDMEIFKSQVSGDILSWNLTLKNPDAFGIEKPTTGWGTFNYTDSDEATAQERLWLDRLHAIDRNSLNDSEKITYDTLEQYLEWGIESMDYYYYDEALRTYNGYHSNLALNLIFYDIETYEDVEDYLSLVEDTPRLMGDVLAFEREKSAAGLFMTDAALDEVLEQIDDFVSARDTCYLFTTFDDMIAEVEMTDEQREAFYARNTTAVNALIDSYVTLSNGLKTLRGTGTNSAGLEAYGDEGKAFFELSLKQAACMDMTVDEINQILLDEVEYINSVIEKYIDVYSSKFDTIKLSVGTTEQNIDYLKTLIPNDYPALPEHTVTYIDCPEELESQFSPAAYLIPPVDDASENLIILNNATLSDEMRYLNTLAHEGYPGHLYHYMYIRTLNGSTGYTRQNMGLTGYYEAWSQSGEEFFDRTTKGLYPTGYCTYMTANSTLGGLLIPSIISIGVNYYGWTVDEVIAYISRYYGSETGTEYGKIYYQEAVNNPFYFLEYAIGFSYYQQMYRQFKDEMTDFSQLDFNTQYLNIGPTYFHISRPIMDEWKTMVSSRPQD